MFSKKLCSKCRTREVWLNYNTCFECYMNATDPNKPQEPKRESYSVLDLPGKKIKVKIKKKKKQ